jgi:hypothetical protein
MPKSGPLLAVLQVLTIAAATAAAALAVTWPRVTAADPGDGSSALAERGTKLGTVQAEGKLVRDPATLAWRLELHAHNRGSANAVVAVRAGVLRTVSDPRTRAEPTAVTVWREDTTLRLGPDETLDTTFAIPDKVAERLTRDVTAPDPHWYRAPMGGGGHVTTTYDVVLLRIKA